MSLASEVKAVFGIQSFNPACTNEDIGLAENLLGHSLPVPLRDFYLEMNGFVGPTDAQFSYPLLQDETNLSLPSLVGFTLFLRSEDYFPDFLKRAVAIGDSGVGTYWLVLLDHPERVALWDATWGEEFEWLDGGLLDVWSREKSMYDSIDQSTL